MVLPYHITPLSSHMCTTNYTSPRNYNCMSSNTTFCMMILPRIPTNSTHYDNMDTRTDSNTPHWSCMYYILADTGGTFRHSSMDIRLRNSARHLYRICGIPADIDSMHRRNRTHIPSGNSVLRCLCIWYIHPGNCGITPQRNMDTRSGSIAHHWSYTSHTRTNNLTKHAWARVSESRQVIPVWYGTIPRNNTGILPGNSVRRLSCIYSTPCCNGCYL